MPIFQRVKFTILIIFLVPTGTIFAQTEEPDFTAPVFYPSALMMAIERDPRLDLTTTVAEAAEGRIEQADLPPNPVVGTEFENFLGTGPVAGTRGIEVTLGISQLIETADKRERRTTLARHERDLVDWQREVLIAEIEANVRQAFVEALMAQETVALRQDQLVLSERGEIETARLVDAALSPRVELTRAQLAIRQQQFALDQAQRNLSAARNALAALWGLTPAPDFQVEGKIVLESSLPGMPELIALLPNTVSLAQFKAVSRAREATFDLMKARATPDIEVFAGGRYLNEADENYGLVAGIEIPWPLFDKNQGNIRTAQARVHAVELERAVVRRTLLVRLSSAYHSLTNAHADAMAVQSGLLPVAEQTLADMEVGYERGQFTQLAVLESRQILFKVRETYLDALTRYARAKAEIEALTRPATLK